MVSIDNILEDIWQVGSGTPLPKEHYHIQLKKETLAIVRLEQSN